MDTYEVIANAIKSKLQVIADYDGLEREFCPHMLGWKEGRAQALCFQFAGGSRTGLPEGGQWRCMTLAKMSNVRTRPGDWYDRETQGNPSYCIDDDHIDFIVAK